MAKSEKSYLDRLGRTRLLLAVVEGCSPAFLPGDDSLTVVNFTAFLNTVEAANEQVADLETDYSLGATERVNLVKSLRDAVTQAVGYVRSNRAWATQFKAVKMAADKLRNIRPRAKEAVVPPGEPGGEQPAERATRSRGEQAYVELQVHLTALIAALTACDGYNPPSDEITLVAFDGLLTQFRGLNLSLGQLAGQLTTAREVRRQMYYHGEECLKEKFQAIKNAVKGQYGTKSTAWHSVWRIKW
jgi:hypothetical protein